MLVALALVADAPWLIGFAAVSVLVGPIRWSGAVAASLVAMGELLAPKVLPHDAERAAWVRVRTALWGLAAMAVAFGATVGAGAWWIGPGYGVRGDVAPARRAMMRMALVRVGRAAIGLGLVYLTPR